MFPWLLLFRVGLSLIGKSQVYLLATTRVRFRVWPNDLDFNLHANNGRYLARHWPAEQELLDERGRSPSRRHLCLGNARRRRPASHRRVEKIRRRQIRHGTPDRISALAGDGGQPRRLDQSRSLAGHCICKRRLATSSLASAALPPNSDRESA